MKKKKAQIASLLLASAMAFSLTGCGGSDSKETTTAATTAAATEATTEAASTEEATTEAPAPAAASIDFEDGNFAFIKGAAGTEVSLADFNGSKAVKVVNADVKAAFGLNVSQVLGSDTDKVATITIDMGIVNPDGKFQAVSGKMYSYTGEKLEEVQGDAWSVYTESANPKTAKFDVSGAGFIPGMDNYFIIQKETDNGVTKGEAAAEIYIDNISFLDAEGNVLVANSAADFGSPANFGSAGVDRGNLFGIIKPLAVDATPKGDAWAQDGFDMSEDFKAALVPGSVVEINYKSETGHMWIVMPDSEAGWMRVGVGDCDGSGQQYAYTNNAGNTAQITYEQIAAVCGEDVSKWGARMQFESDGAWEVTSVCVGTAAPNYVIEKGAVDLGAAVKADAWAQDGVELSEEAKAALVPGSVVEISYKSDTGHMWIVMPDAEAGWMRVGVGDWDGSGQGYITNDGSKAYVPYEVLAEILGEDVSKWGARMQFESDSPWEVTGARIGTAGQITPNNSQLDLGAAVKADAWAQDGVELSDDAIAALVPGSVINASYKSDSGELWLVFPDAEKGWTRVGVGDYDGSGQGYAACTGTSMQVTYEEIAEILGDDTSKWGKRVQFEASSPWEVTSASIGTVK